jgi:type IV fimbrial biogenesis protein FimT
MLALGLGATIASTGCFDDGRIGRAPTGTCPGRSFDLQTGFTLLELMFTLLVIAVLATLGVPSMQQMLERNQLKSAARTLMSDLQWMRGEAIRRNRPLHLAVDADAWCYGITTRKACNCLAAPDAADACVLDTADTPVLKRVGSADLPGVRIVSVSSSLGNPPRLGFEPRRATATSYGSLTFGSRNGAQLRLILSKLGRVRVCSPNDAVPGYSRC